MNIRIEKQYQARIPFDVERSIRKLLKNVPSEHLIGLGSIFLVDQLSHKPSHKSAGLYWHKKGHESAKIEIAISTIYKGMPRPIFYFPFIAKFMLASVLFHEVGHHYQQYVHSVTKKTEEAFAEKYRKQMLKRAFSSWRLFLLPLSPLVFLLRRAGNKSNNKKKGVVAL